MGLRTFGGAELYIGGTGDLASEEDWVRVSEITDYAGQLGRIFNEIEHNPVGGGGETQFFKGGWTRGQFNLVGAADLEDEGQEAMENARDDRVNNYNFKLELDDQPAASGSTPTRFLFKAQVITFNHTFSTRDELVGWEGNIRPQTESITEPSVDAAA